RHHGRLVLVLGVVEGRLDAGRQLAGALGGHQDQLEAVLDDVQAIFDGNAGHADSPGAGSRIGSLAKSRGYAGPRIIRGPRPTSWLFHRAATSSCPISTFQPSRIDGRTCARSALAAASISPGGRSRPRSATRIQGLGARPSQLLKPPCARAPGTRPSDSTGAFRPFPA